MKKIISLLISAVMVLSVFTALPASSFAAKKKAQKVSLKKTSATLKISEKNGKKVYGTTKINVKKAKGVKLKKVSYKSTNKKIAAVDKKGVVKAKKKGTASIKVNVKYIFKKHINKKTLTFKVKVKNTIKKAAAPVEATTVPATEAEETTTVATTCPVDANTTEPTEPETYLPIATELATDPDSTNEPATNGDIFAPTGGLAPTGGDYMPTNDIQGDTGHCTDFDKPGVTDPDWTGVTKPDGSPYYEYYASQPYTNNDIQGDTGHCTDLDNPGVTDPNWTGVTKPDGSPYYEYYTSQPYTNNDIQGDTGHCTDLDNPGVTDPDWTGVTKPDGSPYYEYYDTTQPATEELSYNAKLSAFSNKLYNMCVNNLSDNYVMSPVSVYMALSMLYYSGDDGVKSDIRDFVEMNDSDLKKTGELFNSLVREYSDYDWENDKSIVTSKLSLSNSVWFDSNVKMDEQAVKKLADELCCEAKSTTFKDDNKTANEEIQEFVKENTQGLIDENFEIAPDTLFALINTLYFKDIWDRDMVNGLNTMDYLFHTYYNYGINREFLIGKYLSGQVQETDKSYYFYTVTSHGYRVKFILPKDGYTLKQAMSPDNLNKINMDSEFNAYDEKGVKHLTRCIFPSFKIECDTPLMQIFKNNEVLQNAFSSYYSPLTENKEQPISVSQIIHKTVIDVNKDGIEGAAVTVIANAGSAAPEPEEYHDFMLDRSFGFMVTTYDNVILFEGQVTE